MRRANSNTLRGQTFVRTTARLTDTDYGIFLQCSARSCEALKLWGTQHLVRQHLDQCSNWEQPFVDRIASNMNTLVKISLRDTELPVKEPASRTADGSQPTLA